MLKKQKLLTAAIAAMCMVFMLSIFLLPTDKVQASSGYGFVILNTYDMSMEIGEESYLIAVPSDGKKVTFLPVILRWRRSILMGRSRLRSREP